MPKEITHWTLAEKIYSLLGKNSQLEKIIRINKNLYYLGSVIPDSPFYCILGRKVRSVIQTGLRFHNNRGNSFEPISEIINIYNRDVPLGVWAFILGVITHVMVDSSYHPFVNFFAGNIRDRRISKLVRSRHRELETYLDLYYMDSTNNRLFQMNYKNKEMGERDFLQLVSILLFGRTDEDNRSVKKMIKLHSLIQRSFYKKWLLRILKFLQVFPGVYMKDKISLYYPRSIPFKSTFFKNPVTFLHPVTGEKQETSVVRIEDKCIGDTLSIFGALEDNWGKKDVFDVLFMFPAPNLHTGMVDTTTDDMLFFDTSKKIEELLL